MQPVDPVFLVFCCAFCGFFCGVLGGLGGRLYALSVIRKDVAALTGLVDPALRGKVSEASAKVDDALLTVSALERKVNQLNGRMAQDVAKASKINPEDLDFVVASVISRLGKANGVPE